jgi:hypothetical protein
MFDSNGFVYGMIQKVYMIQKGFVCRDDSKGLHLDRSCLIQKAFSFAGMIHKVYT